jgi:sugar lactone lactonase YvrE
MSETTILLDGLEFPECPRWRDGRLWFSDVHAQRVLSVDLAGNADVVLELDDRPTGLGFLPDGSLLVVSADRRLVLRLRDGNPSVHADLSGLPVEWLNDMVVTPDGRAYVDAIAHVVDPGGDDPVDMIVVVEPDGSWRVAAESALRPNGIAVTPDGTGARVDDRRRRRPSQSIRVGRDGPVDAGRALSRQRGRRVDRRALQGALRSRSARRGRRQDDRGPGAVGDRLHARRRRPSHPVHDHDGSRVRAGVHRDCRGGGRRGGLAVSLPISSVCERMYR